MTVRCPLNIFGEREERKRKICKGEPTFVSGTVLDKGLRVKISWDSLFQEKLKKVNIK